MRKLYGFGIVAALAAVAAVPASVAGMKPAIVPSVKKLTFSPLPIGNASSYEYVTFTNTSGADQELSPTQMTGNVSDFSVSAGTVNDCGGLAGAVLPAGQSCDLAFTFLPSAKGNRKVTFYLPYGPVPRHGMMGPSAKVTLQGKGLPGK
jgi:hypothetical protein